MTMQSSLGYQMGYIQVSCVFCFNYAFINIALNYSHLTLQLSSSASPL